jgi:hypothetical protein
VVTNAFFRFLLVGGKKPPATASQSSASGHCASRASRSKTAIFTLFTQLFTIDTLGGAALYISVRKKGCLNFLFKFPIQSPRWRIFLSSHQSPRKSLYAGRAEIRYERDEHGERRT